MLTCKVLRFAPCMIIALLGQMGLPKFNTIVTKNDTPEHRAQALSKILAEKNNTVVVTGTHPFAPKDSHNFGITTLYCPSLSPDRPGGWFYILVSVIRAIFQRPTVVHVHDWQSALLVAIAKPLFSKDTVFVLTIDALPTSLSRLACRLVSSRFHAITTPTRQLQYQLLALYSIRTEYIPDGYCKPPLSPIPLRHFGLTRNRYSVAFAQSIDSLKTVANAYASLRTKKKLVVIGIPPKSPSLSVLKKKYPFLAFCEHQTPRTTYSLLKSAALTILGDNTIPLRTVLAAMDSESLIIAVNHPAYQETIGTYGFYYKPDDASNLAEDLKKVMTCSIDHASQIRKQASLRARKHFQWQRIASEYLILYSSEKKVVAMDSIRKVLKLETIG